MGYPESKSRPKVELEKETLDKVVEAISIVGFLMLIFISLFFYNYLPEEIPTHYGADGKPDAFGGKSILWALPLIGLFIYIGLNYLNRFPHRFNYPAEVTEENALRLYTGATRMMRLLNMVIVLAFLFICVSTILIALGKQESLGKAFTPVFLLTTFSITGYGMYKSLSQQ